MADRNAIPQIFDDNLRALRRQRAIKRIDKTGLPFLLERCVNDVAERIQDINRRFKKLIILGDFDIRSALMDKLPADNQPDEMIFTQDISPLESSRIKADLVISLLHLQSENDLPGQISRMARLLDADGLLIIAILGGETLTELRQVLYKTDEDTLGGLTARIYPMMTYSQAAQLLGRAGLNLPVIDMDRFIIRYSSLERLIADIRDIGETNILFERSRHILTKSYKHLLDANYAKLFSEHDKLKASFEIIWLTGWAPHESQQKPLRPGSAKMRLSDALKTTEQKL